MSNKRLIGVCQIYLLCAAACCGPTFLAKFANFANFCIELQNWGGWIGGYQVHLVNCFCTASTKGRNQINLSYNLSLVWWWHQFNILCNSRIIDQCNQWRKDMFCKILPDTLQACIFDQVLGARCLGLVFYISQLCLGLELFFYILQLFSLQQLSFTRQPVMSSVKTNQI